MRWDQWYACTYLELGSGSHSAFCNFCQMRCRKNMYWSTIKKCLERQQNPTSEGIRSLLDSLWDEQWLSDNLAQILCMREYQEQQTNKHWTINRKYQLKYSLRLGCLRACLTVVRVAYNQALWNKSIRKTQRKTYRSQRCGREVRLEMVWIALEVNNGRLTARLTWTRGSHWRIARDCQSLICSDPDLCFA